MNNTELNELLRRARIPECSKSQSKELAAKIMRFVGPPHCGAVNRSPDQRTEFPRDTTSAGWRRFRPLALWSIGVATACLLCGFLIGRWEVRHGAQRDEIAAARKLFFELRAMFPDQLEAVVFDGPTPRLLLAEGASANKGAPIFVRICGAQGCQRVITFSGQRVPLNGETCEVLLDARGHVIVTGEHFAWWSGDGRPASGAYRIEAAPLAGVL